MPENQTGDPSYHRFFKRKKISGVILDMDNTLIDTDPYYEKAMSHAAVLVTQAVNKGNRKKLKESFVREEINNIVLEAYLADRRPTLISDFYADAVKVFLKKNKLTSKEKSVLKSLNHFFDSFYKNSPEPFPSTLRILNILSSVPDTKLAIYSHAQPEWTDIKIQYIQSLFSKKYRTQIDIPFATTPIEEVKDSRGWSNAAKLIGISPEKVLVVGDNWHADILAAVYAGCKNLIWINSTRSMTKERKEEIKFIKKKANANIYTATSISSVKNIISKAS